MVCVCGMGTGSWWQRIGGFVVIEFVDGQSKCGFFFVIVVSAWHGFLK